MCTLMKNATKMGKWKTTISNEFVELIQNLINWGKLNITEFKENEISDGYHTFNELYEFRKTYNALLFNEWSNANKFDVHKSWKHNDGELCFGGGWFIVSAMLPYGQISNHYKAKDWDLFKIHITETAKYKYDGHGANDVLKRLHSLLCR